MRLKNSKLYAKMENYEFKGQNDILKSSNYKVKKIYIMIIDSNFLAKK